MERRIIGFAADGLGEWVATLDCFHRQHVRHAPPFRSAPWVLVDVTREQRVGSTLDCPLCERAELPDGLVVARTTATWDEVSMPAALRRSHRVAAGTWGHLWVVDGRVRFLARTNPVLAVVVGAGSSQPIPPEVEHEVDPLGHVRFFVEFLRPAPAS